jgi:hypothetical protein
VLAALRDFEGGLEGSIVGQPKYEANHETALARCD